MSTNRRDSKLLTQMVRMSGASNPSQQVMPIDEEEEDYDDYYDDDESPEMNVRYKRRSQFSLNSVYNRFTYDNAVAAMRWVLQTAAIDITFNVSPLPVP